jgi:hypothetical protein
VAPYILTIMDSNTERNKFMERQIDETKAYMKLLKGIKMHIIFTQLQSLCQGERSPHIFCESGRLLMQMKIIEMERDPNYQITTVVSYLVAKYLLEEIYNEKDWVTAECAVMNFDDE